MEYDRGDGFPLNFEPNKIPAKIDRKPVSTIIFHSIWKELKICFCKCNACHAGREKITFWAEKFLEINFRRVLCSLSTVDGISKTATILLFFVFCCCKKQFATENICLETDHRP